MDFVRVQMPAQQLCIQDRQTNGIMMTEYKGRDYQHAAMDAVLKCIDGGSKGVLVAMATGTGKTILASMLANHMDSLLFIVDREELAFQSQEKLQAITGRPVALECGSEYKAFKTSPTAKIVVAMSQSMIRRLGAYSPDRFQYMMEDECFPSGTLVDGRAIETIKAGDIVNSFCHTTGRTEKKRVIRTSKRFATSLVRVVLKSGKSFICTPCHPFFVRGEEDSYVRACDLRQDHVLMKGVFNGNRSYCDMRELPERNGVIKSLASTASGISSQKDWQSVLHRCLQENENQSGCIAANGSYKSKICKRSDEKAESDELRTDSRKDEELNEGKSVQGKRRQWDGANSPSVESVSGSPETDSRNNHGTCRPDEDTVPTSTTLQTGYRHRGDEALHRSGRTESLPNSQTTVGQEEGSFSECFRVDFIESIEQTSDGTFGGMCSNGEVYNLEVDGNHNYFVDGFLVHNCHHSIAATRTAIRNHFVQKRAVIGFSATPERHDGRALGMAFDTTAFEMDYITSVDLGWLCQFKSRVLSCHDMDLRGFKKAVEFNQEALRLQTEKEAVVERIATKTLAIADGRQTVIFAQTVRQSEQINRYLKSIGERSTHVDGKMHRHMRRERLAQFGMKNFQFICNCGLIEEGVDVPGIEVVSMAAPIRSTARFIQRVGRGSRAVCDLTGATPEIRRQQIADSEKPHFTVIDFIGQMDDHCSSMCFSGDLLGGNFDDEERKVAIRLASGNDSPDMKAIMAEAKEIVAKRRAKLTPLQEKEEARKRYQKAGRAQEQAWAITTIFDPFVVLRLDKRIADKEVSKEEMYGRSLDASQQYLKACQLTPAEVRLLGGKEIVYLARVLRARAGSHCSYIQSRGIHARGYDAGNLTKSEGNRLMSRIVEAGYVRPEEDGPNEVYEKSLASKVEPVTKQQNYTFV